jgi:hypothetical protein
LLLRGAVFFQLSGVVPMESAVPLLKESIRKAYGKKGEKVVMQNCAAVDGAVSALVKIDVPAAWANAADAPEGRLGHSHTPAAQVGETWWWTFLALWTIKRPLQQHMPHM